MDFKQVFSREYLQTERARHLESLRVQVVTNHINNHCQHVIMSARDGKTQHIVDTNSHGMGNYNPTINDLLEGYRMKFPGCKVEYGETWEQCPRNPNQMNKKSGIIIDWS